MLINSTGLLTELNGQKVTGEIFTDDVTKKKVRKHLINPNDTITEQDLLNVKTAMTPATIEQERMAAEAVGIDIPGDGL
jgi:hypothetical protein